MAPTTTPDPLAPAVPSQTDEPTAPVSALDTPPRTVRLGTHVALQVVRRTAR